MQYQVLPSKGSKAPPEHDQLVDQRPSFHQESPTRPGSRISLPSHPTQYSSLSPKQLSPFVSDTLTAGEHVSTDELAQSGAELLPKVYVVCPIETRFGL